MRSGESRALRTAAMVCTSILVAGYVYQQIVSRPVPQFAYRESWRRTVGAVAGPVVFAPDSGMLAVGISHRLSKGNTLTYGQSEIQTISAETGSALERWSVHGNQLTYAEFLRDGSAILTSGLDTAIKLWNPKTRDLISVIESQSRVGSAALSPDGRLLASSSSNGTGLADSICVQEMPSGRILWRRDGLYLGGDVFFSPDGSTVIYRSGSDPVTSRTMGYLLALSDARTGALRGSHPDIRLLGGYPFSSDGRLAVIMDGRDLCICEMPSFHITRRIDWIRDVYPDYDPRSERAYGISPHSASFSPDGRVLALGFSDAEGTKTALVSLRDVRTGRQIKLIRYPSTTIETDTYVSFSRDGKYFAVAGGGMAACWGRAAENAKQ